jgi:hypothetical protein
MASIRVTVVAGRRRARLKAVASDGYVEIIENIPREAAAVRRNQLLERLVASGRYDEVIAEALPAFPDAPPEPWVRKPGDPNTP